MPAIQGCGLWPGQWPEPHLGLTKQLLELRLWQEAVVLHKCWDLRWPLTLIVHGAVDLHVLVEDGQELLLALQKEEEEEEMMTDPPSHSEGRAGRTGILLWAQKTGSHFGVIINLLCRLGQSPSALWPSDFPFVSCGA